MHNVRFLLFAAAVTVSILACDLASTPVAPSVSNVATVVASTIQALTPPAPEATPTQAAQTPQGIPVKYKNVSFILPAGLATDAAPQTVPATTDQTGAPWDAAPEHIEFRLNNYNVPAKSFGVCQIDIYPAQDYANAGAGANIALQRLQGLVSNPSAPLAEKTLPHVPFFNADAMISAQVKRVHFQNGDGISMVTQYGQAVTPIANSSTFYQFIGLTSDGKYLIVAVLPVQAPILVNTEDTSISVPAGGVPFPPMDSSDAQVFENYFQAVTDKLNGLPPEQFSPSLTALDALVQSFSVSP